MEFFYVLRCTIISVMQMFSIKNNLFIYILGATAYCLVEIIWRGYSHYTMFFLGGFCCLTLYKLAALPYSSVTLALLGSLIITAAELLCGILFNKLLKLNVWDYSGVPYNFMGQICPFYSFAWFVLSFFAIVLIKRCILN